MRYAKGHKAKTRRHIVAAAAAEFRKKGISGTRVSEVMARAGLTHGGFYAHFASKRALAREALGYAIGETAALFTAITETVPRERRLAAILDRYLSLEHRSHPESGCVLAALGTELAREHAATKMAIRADLDRMVRALMQCLPEPTLRAVGDKALAMLACMVGAMVMARLLSDDVAAERLLASCKSFLHDRMPT